MGMYKGWFKDFLAGWRWASISHTLAGFLAPSALAKPQAPPCAVCKAPATIAFPLGVDGHLLREPEHYCDACASLSEDDTAYRLSDPEAGVIARYAGARTSGAYPAQLDTLPPREGH
jgi:hypothetical protein